MEEEQNKLKKQLEEALKNGAGPKVARLALAFLSGIVPIAGGLIGGAASAWSEKEQSDLNNIFAAWLKMQEEEIKEIGITLMEVMIKIDRSNEEISNRIKSPEYLSIVKKAFRDWSAAESEKKRQLIRNLLINAASTKICNDDMVKIFIDWIAQYTEAHFAVIKEIYHNPGISRHSIWENINNNIVPEDSAEADMYKLLIRDLSMGGIVRQERKKDYMGRFIKEKRQYSKSSQSQFMTSAFDDKQGYELTELGKQFVHYTMNEDIARIGLESV